MKFYQAMRTEKISGLIHRKPVTIHKTTQFSEIIKKLQEAKSGCAVVLEDQKVIGIITEQDILKRGVLANISPSTPAEKFMTPSPQMIQMEDHLAKAIRLMHDGKYRHLPVIDPKGQFLALISVRDIVFFLSELYPYEVLNQPPDPHQISASPEGA